MSLSKAIKKRDMKELKKTVKAATKIYSTKRPEAQPVNTVYGDLPLSAIFDKETIWMTITTAYADIVQQVGRLPENANLEVETAKLIAQNAVFRNVTTKSTASKNGLL